MTSAVDALRALDASLQSEREWRNIQKTVEMAVRHLFNFVSAQQQRLETLENRLQTLEAVDSMEEFVDMRSATAAEMKDAIRESHAQLTERVCAHVDVRLAGQREEMEHVWTEREEKSSRQYRDTLDAVRTEIMDETKRTMATQKPPPPPPRVEDAKLDSVERKLQRVEKQLRATETAFSTEWRDWRDELTQTLAAKATESDVTAALASHVQEFGVQIESLREELQVVTTDCATRAEAQTKAHDELKTHMHELIGIVETLQSDQVVLKTLTVDHVQNSGGATTDHDARDTKRAVLKLHDAVKSVRRSVEAVAKRADVEALGEQVVWIRKQLRSEIYQARYIWKEGPPTAKQTVAWTAQVMNSSPEVFVWQRSCSDAVTTIVPGLYYLQAAFFTRLEPVLQVFVNGEPALILTSAVPDNSDAENDPSNQAHGTIYKHHGSRRRRLHHSAGDIVGVELCAFLALPARAVVTIGYDIAERAQGFLTLRKL